jgi:hypothetical protein
MAAPPRCIAVACLALFAILAAGCMISRPCDWDQWRYQSNDGRYRGRDDWDSSPPLVLDQQARTRPHGDRSDFGQRAQRDRGETGNLSAKAKPNLGNAAAARVAVYSEKPRSKPKVAQKPAPPAVATVQWQEPEDMPPPPKRSEPKRQAKNTNSRPAEPAARATSQVDRTPFHWGFFGAETRW